MTVSPMAINRVKAHNAAAAKNSRAGRRHRACCGGRLLLSPAARAAPILSSLLIVGIVGLFLMTEGRRLPGPRLALLTAARGEEWLE